MRTPIFLNESRAIDERGDLRLFEELDALRRHVEPVDVENEEYFAFDAEGRLLTLSAARGRIDVVEAEPMPAHASVLARLLREDLPDSRYPDGRVAATPAWCEAASLEQLVARAVEVDRAWRAGRMAQTARRWIMPG